MTPTGVSYMQLTNLQILNATQGLSALSQQKLPIRLAWQVNTAIRSLEPFVKAVEEPLQEIRIRYAKKDDMGNLLSAEDTDGNPLPNTVQIPNEKIVEVNKEMDSLLGVSVEVSNVSFKLSEFPNTLQLEPAVLSSLTPLITDDTVADLALVK
jgi:hypothetical protein